MTPAMAMGRPAHLRLATNAGRTATRSETADDINTHAHKQRRIGLDNVRARRVAGDIPSSRGLILRHSSPRPLGGEAAQKLVLEFIISLKTPRLSRVGAPSQPKSRAGQLALALIGFAVPPPLDQLGPAARLSGVRL
jgi:hypothetical protein